MMFLPGLSDGVHPQSTPRTMPATHAGHGLSSHSGTRSPSYDWRSPFNMTAGLCWVLPPGSALARGTRMRNWTGVTSQWPKPTSPQHEPNTTKALLLESAALSQNFHYTTQKMRSVNILSSALSHVQRNWLMFFWSSYLIFSCIFYVSCSQKSDTRWH